MGIKGLNFGTKKNKKKEPKEKATWELQLVDFEDFQKAMTSKEPLVLEPHL